jgi:murein L,D-transpeptidase YafK
MTRRIALGLTLLTTSLVAGCLTRSATRTFIRAQLPVREVCRREHITYPPKRIFIRVFKAERELELWGGNPVGKLSLLQTYPIAAASGGPGPKRREGDMQVPEGLYRVVRFNPHSRFHLSLGLDYPNRADRLLGDRKRLGGDIFIHGNHVSAGCMAMTDSKIEEIFALAKLAKGPIAVHIFPCRMDGATYRQLCGEHPELTAFWEQLEPIYRSFEAAREVPKVSVLRNGAYRLEN